MFYEYAINLPLNRLNAFYDLLEKIKKEQKQKNISDKELMEMKFIKFLEELKEEDFTNKNVEYSSLYFEQWKKLVWKNIFYFFLPNMFFHMTTAYDIVRHFGFDVGKADFLWRATFDLFE